MHIGTGFSQAMEHRLFRSMFEERKRVFVDLLRWDVPVIAGRYEIDQFDNDRAVYIVVTGDDGEHRASARLLPTTHEHILGTIFPDLCEEAPPRGGAILEITRFCLARKLRAWERLEVRNPVVPPPGTQHDAGTQQERDTSLEQDLGDADRCRGRTKQEVRQIEVFVCADQQDDQTKSGGL